MIIGGLNDFDKLISQNDIFEDVEFNLDNKEMKIYSFKSDWVQFNDCIFNCEKLSILNITKNELQIEFKNCTFNCDVYFENCHIDSLSFLNTKTIKSLKLYNGFKREQNFTINKFNFSNNIECELTNGKTPILTTSFSFHKIFFKQYFEFNNVKNTNGIFSFTDNLIGDIQYEKNSSCVFNSSKLSNINFTNNKFNTYTSFKNSTFYFNNDNFNSSGSHWNESKFERNEFNKVNFSEVEFDKFLKFEKCDFLSTTWFESCVNLKNTHLKFVACEFKGFSLFNDSKINFLDIDRCTFHKSSSFTDAEFNKIKLYEVKFGGGAYFDEMKINKVIDKTYLKDKTKILEWKRTLRAIKQELQKTENKIDFNSFRGYELAAHYKELDWKFKSGFKDKFILWATKWSSNFGSWVWAFWFTIISGFFWYSILYRIEYSGSYNPEKIESFFIGLFRFFLVTDFFSPFEVGRIYLSNSFSWIPFILGKIFIAFGIYEMIQSFRKFKA